MGGAGPWQSITAPATGVTTDTVIDVIADTPGASQFGVLSATWILQLNDPSGSAQSCQLTVRASIADYVVAGGYEPTIISDGQDDPYTSGDIDVDVDFSASNFQLRLLVTSGAWNVSGIRTFDVEYVSDPA
jgi:hypothetical protein